MNRPLKAVFSKTGLMVFLSHLDLVRLFQRAARRAALPVTLTKGYNPRLKISITRALKLGIESDSLEALFYLDSQIDPEEFRVRLNHELPQGIEVRRAEVA